MPDSVSEKRSSELRETLLAVVGRALARPTNGPSLREAFEDGLRQVLPIRAGQLRRGGHSGGSGMPARGTEAFVIDVPAVEQRALFATQKEKGVHAVHRGSACDVHEVKRTLGGRVVERLARGLRKQPCHIL